MKAFAMRWIPGTAGLAALAHSTAAAADEYVDFDPTTAAPATSAPLFVVLAYGAMWLGVIGFVLLIWRRQRRIDQDLAELQQRLVQGAARPAPDLRSPPSTL